MKLIDFIKGSITELTENVTWPTYRELQSTTVIVIVASLVFALVIGLIDLAFENGMGLIYGSL